MKIRIALCGALFVACISEASANDAAVDATISQFATAFNKGDMKAAKALHVASPTIIDEVAPHLWSGPNAFDSWGAALAKSEAAEGRSGGQVTIGAPTREVVSGDHAYAIAPTTYTFKQKGMTMRETAQMTLTLDKQAAGWKIASWTGTGPEAKPVR
ncbi:MAG: nuclear transport factor 2 family protein [Pseudomonadota bacterium]